MFFTFYKIFDVKDHNLRKEDILFHMRESGRIWPNEDGTTQKSWISNTDWKDGENKQVEWMERAFSLRDLKRIKRITKSTRCTSAWFNQYNPNTGSTHPWHSHKNENSLLPFNDLTNIYFVELKDYSLRPILKHPKSGKEIIPRVKEGQILSFSADILHMSPQNYTTTRKSVLSFNTLLSK